jgi:uncharacterized protein
MKKNIMKIICCPSCKNELDLTVEKQDNEEIITGFLFCKQCNIKYPIKEGIPNLLPQQ